MRHLLAFPLFFLIASWVSAQKYGKDLLFTIPFDSATEKYTMQAVEEAPGQSADQLFLLAKGWMQMKVGMQRLDYDSLETHTLIQRMSFRFSITNGMTTVTGYLRFRITIETKDKKYRCRITDFETTSSPNATIASTLENWYEVNRNMRAATQKQHTTLLNELVEQTEKGTRKVIAELKAAMAGEKEDDW